MANRSIPPLILLSLLLSTPVLASSTADYDGEDLSFLEEPESADSLPSHRRHTDGEDEAFVNYGDLEDSEFADEKDVVVLKGRNFSDFIDENKHVMVEFYASWCGHCQSLALEYAAAATELKAANVTLAKVDATEENELAEIYDVQGLPTIYFFADGEHIIYSGRRTKNAIVTWIKKKTGPRISNITTTEYAERILTSEDKVVLAFLDSLVGPDSEEFSAASELDDDVKFYQTANPNVAKLFNMEADATRPAVVLLKKEAEKVTHFDGQFKKSVIAKFVSVNKLPLVTPFSRVSSPLISQSPIKKQLLLFATSNNSQEVFRAFQEAARLFKGKVLGIAVNEEDKRYILDHEEITLEKIKAFGEAFLEDRLKPFLLWDPIPQNVI